MPGRNGLPKHYAALSLVAMWQIGVVASVQAEAAWVATSTHAVIVQNSGTHQVTLATAGHPAIDASHISPLEESQPLHIAVSLRLRNSDQLQAFIHGINDPASPDYHKYLTPDQLKAQYAPTEQQVQGLVTYLRSHGFTNIQVPPNNMLVTADGHASNVNSAFHAAMQRFSYEGAPHFANAEDIAVPPFLGSIVEAVLGLQDVSTPRVLRTPVE